MQHTLNFSISNVTHGSPADSLSRQSFYISYTPGLVRSIQKLYSEAVLPDLKSALEIHSTHISLLRYSISHCPLVASYISAGFCIYFHVFTHLP